MASSQNNFITKTLGISHVDYYYPHFSIRLGQRYKMIISREEYLELCKQELELLYIISSNKRLGYVKLRNTKVLVIRCNASNCLNTCLNPGQQWPVPNRYKNKGISVEVFNRDLQNIFRQVNVLIKYLEEHNGDLRKMFKEKPGNHPDWMYGAAANKFLSKDKSWMPHLIKKMYKIRY